MGTPILHVQGRTTPWQRCTGVTGLSAGTIWWRWYAGSPELQFRDAEWVRNLVIPWPELAPAPPLSGTHSRHVREVMQGTSLPAGVRVAMWNGGLYFSADSPGPMRGNITYSV